MTEPFRTRVARAGLTNLMRDPRYDDVNHPEHGALVDLVQRGFQMIFDGPEDRAKRNPRAPGPAPRPGLLDTVLKTPLGTGMAKPEDFDIVPNEAQERAGRRVMLGALREDGFALPSGLREEAKKISLPAAPTRTPARAKTADRPAPPPSGEETRLAQNGSGTVPRPGQTPDPRTAPQLRQSQENTPKPTLPKEPPFRPRLPVDENGKEIRPHHADPRFNPDGTVTEDFSKNTALRWAVENSRYNPKTGDLEFYDQLPEFQRDTRMGQRGRWRRVTTEETRDEFPEPANPKRRIPSPPPIPDRGTRKNPKKLGKYLVELGAWIWENFRPEVEKFRREGEKSC